MPFTFAHPAIVLPLGHLSKRTVSLTALVIGSMMPDFEYFIRLKVIGIYGHTLLGLLYFDLPLGSLVFFSYQFIVKNTLIDYLPGYLNTQLSCFKNREGYVLCAPPLFAIIIGLLVGSASHILWDSFTHKTGYFVLHIPGLLSTLSLAGHPIFVFKFLQHISTLVGFLVIAYAIVRLPQCKSTKISSTSGFWYGVSTVAFLLLAIKAAACFNTWSSPSEFPYGDIIVTGISGLLLGLLLACIYTRNKKGPIAGAF